MSITNSHQHKNVESMCAHAITRNQRTCACKPAFPTKLMHTRALAGFLLHGRRCGSRRPSHLSFQAASPVSRPVRSVSSHGALYDVRPDGLRAIAADRHRPSPGTTDGRGAREGGAAPHHDRVRANSEPFPSRRRTGPIDRPARRGTAYAPASAYCPAVVIRLRLFLPFNS